MEVTGWDGPRRTVATVPEGGQDLVFDHIVFAASAPQRPVHAARRRIGRPAAVAAPAPAPADPQHEFLRVACRQAGLDPACYRPSIFNRRAAACMRAIRVRSAGEAAERVHGDPAAGARVLGSLMIGVTSFFRDPGVFSGLTRALGPMCDRGRGLRVVSLGCSDGSEVYSVAILLAERRVLGQAELLGIDCREGAVEAARLGVTSPRAVRGLDAEVQRRYFVPSASGPRVAPVLRAACRWEVGDAFTRPLEPGLDLVLCRNLVIYASPEAARDLWGRIAAALRPGGLLVTGKAERPAPAWFTRVGPCLYRRSEAAA